MREGIAVAGTALVDRINEISAYPKEGELTQIKNVRRALGGCVPNVAIDIKRMEPQISVYAVSAVGNDSDGELLKNILSQNGVDISHMCEVNTQTSFTDVMSISGGQRTFFTYTGACAKFGYEHIDLDVLQVKMLHMGYFLLLEKIDRGNGLRIFKSAKEKGILTSLDMVSDSKGNIGAVKECLPYTDNLIINELEAGMLCGIEPKRENLRAIAKEIKNMGVVQRVIIHAPDIGVCYSESGYFELPSFDLPKGFIKGTTGAGDAFCAGALLGIYFEMGELDILSLASKAAVASLTEVDGISGMRSRHEIDVLCKEFSRKKL